MIKITWETGIIFVGPGRKDQFEDAREKLEETGADVLYVSQPQKLSPALLDLRECRRVLIFVDAQDLEEAQSIVGKSEGVEVLDDYEL